MVRVRHRQAELGVGLRFLGELESRGLLSLTPTWSTNPSLTLGWFERSFAILVRGLNSTVAFQRVLVLVENLSPVCILVFLTPWISSTLARLCPGVLGWWGSW